MLAFLPYPSPPPKRNAPFILVNELRGFQARNGVIEKQYSLVQRDGINVTPLDRMPERPWRQSLVVVLISGSSSACPAKILHDLARGSPHVLKGSLIPFTCFFMTAYGGPNGGPNRHQPKKGSSIIRRGEGG